MTDHHHHHHSWTHTVPLLCLGHQKKLHQCCCGLHVKIGMMTLSPREIKACKCCTPTTCLSPSSPPSSPPLLKLAVTTPTPTTLGVCVCVCGYGMFLLNFNWGRGTRKHPDQGGVWAAKMYKGRSHHRWRKQPPCHLWLQQAWGESGTVYEFFLPLPLQLLFFFQTDIWAYRRSFKEMIQDVKISP